MGSGGDAGRQTTPWRRLALPATPSWRCSASRYRPVVELQRPEGDGRDSSVTVVLDATRHYLVEVAGDASGHVDVIDLSPAFQPCIDQLIQFPDVGHHFGRQVVVSEKPVSRSV
jgi:hypothetical protein